MSYKFATAIIFHTYITSPTIKQEIIQIYVRVSLINILQQIHNKVLFYVWSSFYINLGINILFLVLQTSGKCICHQSWKQRVTMAILLECSGKHVGIRSRPNQTLTRYGFGKKRKLSMISDSKFDNESKLDPSINVSLYHYTANRTHNNL